MRRKPPINAGVPRYTPRPPRAFRDPREPAPRKRAPRPPERNGGRSRHAGQGRAGGGRGAGENYITEPLSPKGLRKETRASTNLKFRPLERAIGADIRASKQRQGEVGDWFQNYLNTVSAGQADTAAAYQQAGATQQAQIGQASAIDSANTAQLQAAAAKDAELRGTSPGNAAAEREAAAQASRNYLASAQAGSTALSGANQHAYLNEQKRIGAGQRIASGKEEQRREAGFRKDRRETRKERGEYATTKRGELRGEERDYLLKRKAFGLEKSEGARSARESAIERGEKRRHESAEERRKNAAQRNENQEQANQNRKARNEGKAGGLTPSERHDRQEGRRNAAATAKSLFEAKKWPSWAALERAVRKESEVSPAEARQAVKKLRKHVEAKRKQEEKIKALTPSPF